MQHSYRLVAVKGVDQGLRRLTEVDFFQWPPAYVVAVAALEIVDADGMKTGGMKPPAGVTADVAGPSCYENGGEHAFLSKQREQTAGGRDARRRGGISPQ